MLYDRYVLTYLHTYSTKYKPRYETKGFTIPHSHAKTRRYYSSKSVFRIQQQFTERERGSTYTKCDKNRGAPTKDR